MKIRVYSNEGSRPFQSEDKYKKDNFNKIFKNLLLQKHWANFNQTWYKVSFGEGIQIYSNKGSHPFPWADNYEIAKYIDGIKKKISPEPSGQTWHKASSGKGDSILFK